MAAQVSAAHVTIKVCIVRANRFAYRVSPHQTGVGALTDTSEASMSCTDAHTPFRIAIGRGDLHAIADHDHTAGVCDLPPRHASQHAESEHCRWEFRFTGTYSCCCEICHCGRMHRRLNRKARHQDQVSVRDAFRGWRAGDPRAFDDLDAPAPRRIW